MNDVLSKLEAEFKKHRQLNTSKTGKLARYPTRLCFVARLAYEGYTYPVISTFYETL